MKLTIHGAAQQVTGSMHLLEVGQYKILIDCGLDYEKDRSLQSNEDFPFNPAAIDVVVLTHAHIDHSETCQHYCAWVLTGKYCVPHLLLI